MLGIVDNVLFAQLGAADRTHRIGGAPHSPASLGLGACGRSASCPPREGREPQLLHEEVHTALCRPTMDPPRIATFRHSPLRTRTISSVTWSYIWRRSFINAAIFSTAWMTVVWSRPPNSRAIAG